MLIKKKTSEEKEKIIDELKDEFIEASQTVSELRKKGKDTEIVEVMLLDVNAKIKMASITEEEGDIETLRGLIEDIKKEVNELVHGSEFDHVYVLLGESFDHVRNDERKKASEKYNEIMALYKILPKELKQTVYSACIELRRRLTKDE